MTRHPDRTVSHLLLSPQASTSMPPAVPPSTPPSATCWAPNRRAPFLHWGEPNKQQKRGEGNDPRSHERVRLLAAAMKQFRPPFHVRKKETKEEEEEEEHLWKGMRVAGYERLPFKKRFRFEQANPNAVAGVSKRVGFWPPPLPRPRRSSPKPCGLAATHPTPRKKSSRPSYLWRQSSPSPAIVNTLRTRRHTYVRLSA